VGFINATIVFATLAGSADEKPSLAIPQDLKTHIDQSIELGRAIYMQDKASAMATDALVQQLGPVEGKGLGGYLTVRESSDRGAPAASWSVFFFTNEASPRIAYRVRVPMDQRRPTVDVASPPEPPKPGAEALFRARQTALAAAQPLHQPMNPVVLPAEALGKHGILVYLIAGTSEPNVAVLGKHYRMMVSDDGGTVLESTPLTKTEIEMSTADHAGGRLEALAVTHLVTDYPLETHVFASMLNNTPIYVGTNRGIWCVDRDSIRLVSVDVPPNK